MGVAPPVLLPPLLERSRHLAALREAMSSAVGTRGGVLVILGGEAGGGKTSLVRRFCAEPRIGRVLWGACDPLFSPRPLGPFLDIAQELGGELRDLVESGGRPYQIAAALAREAQATAGTVVVLEDLHWADEATLDVVSLLGRRIDTIPALLIATYRDDELDRVHPLRRLLGELRGSHSIRRLTAEPLTPAAVGSLAEPYGLDAGALHRATGGNPFFVTEVLAARGKSQGEIPATVRDAVLSRAAKLSDPAAAVVEALSVGDDPHPRVPPDAVARPRPGGLRRSRPGELEALPPGLPRALAPGRGPLG